MKFVRKKFKWICIYYMLFEILTLKWNLKIDIPVSLNADICCKNNGTGAKNEFFQSWSIDQQNSKGT